MSFKTQFTIPTLPHQIWGSPMPAVFNKNHPLGEITKVCHLELHHSPLPGNTICPCIQHLHQEVRLWETSQYVVPSNRHNDHRNLPDTIWMFITTTPREAHPAPKRSDTAVQRSTSSIEQIRHDCPMYTPRRARTWSRREPNETQKSGTSHHNTPTHIQKRIWTRQSNTRHS